MCRSTLTLSIVCLAVAGLASDATAQGFLDGLKNQLQREVQRSIPQIQPRIPDFPQHLFQPPTSTQPPMRAQSSSIPSDGGIKNNSGRFRGNDFFPTQPPAQNYLPPGQSYNPPGQTYIPPNQTYIPPTQTYVSPGQTYIPQSSTYPSGSVQPGGVQPQGPIVAYPGQTTQGSMVTSVPSTSRPSIAPPASEEAASHQPIVIRCPKSASRAASYQLLADGSSYPFTIRPGESQKFNETHRWLVRFGNSTGQTTYRLRGGNTYTFDVDSTQTMQLYREPTVAVSEPPLRQR